MPGPTEAGLGDRPRALVADVKWPHPDRDAASQHVVQIIRELVAIGFAVDFAVIDANEMEGPEPPDELAGARPIRELGVEAILREAAEAQPPYRVAILAWTRVAQLLLEPLRAVSPTTTIVFDTEDVNHVREYRHARVTGNANLLRRAMAMKVAETRALLGADLTIAISDTDAETFRTLGPESRIEIVTLGVDRRESAVPGPADRRGMLFLGNLHAWHNVDATLHLASDILPAARRTRPELTLTVAGAGWAEPVDAITEPAVHRIGAVADLEPVFDQARMFACPLRIGSGIKGKLLAALALGLPVVTSSIGAEGMHLVDGQHCLIADDPDDFVAAAARLDVDDALWQRLSDAGRLHVARHFGQDVVRRQMRAVFEPIFETTAGGRVAVPAQGGT